jgi:ankyrin repeat protein
MTALMIAVENMEFETVRRLLERQVDVNARDEMGQRALHFAIDAEVDEAQHQSEKTGSRIEPRAEMTQLLLTHGAEVKVRDAQGESPLNWAIERRHKRAEELLRQHGAA